MYMHSLVPAKMFSVIRLRIEEQKQLHIFSLQIGRKLDNGDHNGEMEGQRQSPARTYPGCFVYTGHDDQRRERGQKQQKHKQVTIK